MTALLVFAVEGLLIRCEHDALTHQAGELRPLDGLVEQLHRQTRALVAVTEPPT